MNAGNIIVTFECVPFLLCWFARLVDWDFKVSALRHLYGKCISKQCTMDVKRMHTKLLEHCTLNTTSCTLNATHCTLHTIYCTLHTDHCTLNSEPCRLDSAHYREIKRHCLIIAGPWSNQPKPRILNCPKKDKTWLYLNKYIYVFVSFLYIHINQLKYYTFHRKFIVLESKSKFHRYRFKIFAFHLGNILFEG